MAERMTPVRELAPMDGNLMKLNPNPALNLPCFAVMLAAAFLQAITLHAQIPGAGVKKEGLGVLSHGSWSGSGQINRQDNQNLQGVSLVRRWHQLEPVDDDFRFQEEFGLLIEEAHQEGLYVKLLIYVGDESPEWLFDIVPTVNTDHGNLNRFPYYLDAEGIYKAEFFEMIDEFGAFVSGLAPELQDRIHFVFAVEGVTADGAPYKGELLEDSLDYEITSEQWAAFRQETWERYRDALPVGMPIIINIDSNTSDQNAWIIDNMYVVGLKFGMFSHGYHVSDAIQRLEDYRAIELATFVAGKELITEGEEDQEINLLPRGTKNRGQAIYWGGLYATHNPLNLWTVPREYLKPEPGTVFENLSSANEIFKFFNRYASNQFSHSSPRAFIALRDGLNAADIDRFPESEFGRAARNNVARYESIAAAFSSRGAVLEDPNNATRGPFVNRRRAGYNDVGWNILPGNYSRFISQIHPGSGDIGWWHVDVVKKGSSFGEASHYSRFARGFDHSDGKNAMYFDVNDDLANGLEIDRSALSVRVVYFDEVEGSTWQLQYDSGNGTAAVEVTNSGSGEWRTLAVMLKDANLQNGLAYGADIALVNTDSHDDIFHMIEIEYGLGEGVGEIMFHEDIGNVGKVGSASYSSERIIVFASGEDIWGTEDSFHFVHDLHYAGGEISAKVESVEQTHSWAKAGVMFRDSIAPNAACVAVLVRPSGKVVMQWRSEDGEITQNETTPESRREGFPKWVKLRRAGRKFAGYVSDDGVTWDRIGVIEAKIDKLALTGLAATSHDNQTVGQAVFSSVSIPGGQ